MYSGLPCIPSSKEREEGVGGGGGAFFERGTCFLLWPKGEGTYLGEFPYWSKYSISSLFS